jgi:hypothetical protein
MTEERCLLRGRSKYQEGEERMRVRITAVAGLIAAAAAFACTAAPALADTPTQYCAIVGAPAPGPNAASPILGQGCFATQAAQDAFAESTIAAATPSATLEPLSKYHLGVAWSKENLSGSAYNFYGSDPGYCPNGGGPYQFANLNGPFDSAAEDLNSGAGCLDAYYWSGSNFNGRDWDCNASIVGGQPRQTCGVRMPSGDDGAAHSVRFRS